MSERLRPCLSIGLTVLVAIVGVSTLADAGDPSSSSRRLCFGGEFTGTFGPRDPGFFNYTSYQRSVTRLAQVSLTAEADLGPRLAVLGEVRTENMDTVRLQALYVRLRPWRGRRLDVQAGLIPPVFGSFARRGYGVSNLVIGAPLAYQYLTTLRPDAMPRNADDLLRMRGEGWSVEHEVGASGASAGLPLVNGARWDAGVQARWATERLEVGAAVTQGTLSNPRVDDDNGGKQVSARAGWRPVAGLALAASWARGEYVERALEDDLRAALFGRSYRQRAWGGEVEYSRGYGLVRAEGLWSAWDVAAFAAPRIDEPLRALSLSVEGRYKPAPGLSLALRAERLSFSSIRGTAGALSWDAPVARVEGAAGYALRRNLLFRAGYQQNWRSGGHVRRQGGPLVQVLAWF